jgi:hypothetical protein
MYSMTLTAWTRRWLREPGILSEDIVSGILTRWCSYQWILCLGFPPGVLLWGVINVWDTNQGCSYEGLSMSMIPTRSADSGRGQLHQRLIRWQRSTSSVVTLLIRDVMEHLKCKVKKESLEAGWEDKMKRSILKLSELSSFTWSDLRLDSDSQVLNKVFIIRSIM